MNQELFSERLPRPGIEARTYRRGKIKMYASIVKNNRGWRAAFKKEHPNFDNGEGERLLNRATRGATDSPELYEALKVWIPKIQTEQPEWFTKQLAIDVP